MKSRRTRKLYAEGYWPRLRSTRFQPDRVPDSWGVDMRIEDRFDWYRMQSGGSFDTHAEAVAYVLHSLEFYAAQDATISWSINPHYAMTEEEYEESKRIGFLEWFNANQKKERQLEMAID